MNHLTVDFSKATGKVKPMHAVNNGPTGRNNEAYAAAGIPYARNHDASFYAPYGGYHTVDVHVIFPDFDADPTDPASYDFVVTDKYLKDIDSVGTKVFYRLGSKIEHEVKKYGTVPPKDFHKWAVICEHIIRHYTEGWADGLHLDIEYWEIWNEPDANPDNLDDIELKCNWGGSPEEYYELYVITATHLKRCFPHLKIGGPTVCAPWKHPWKDNFFRYITKSGHTPLDFFSFHLYTDDPHQFPEGVKVVQEWLDEYGYPETEIIVDEWNYLRDWSNLTYCFEQVIGLKGSAFTAAGFCEGQNSAMDMMMYYDARPSGWNGLFDFYSHRPLKGYYPFKMFNELYKMPYAVEVTTDNKQLFLCAAADPEKGKKAIFLTYFEDNDEVTKPKYITLDIAGLDKPAAATYYLLDKDRDMEPVGTEPCETNVALAIPPNGTMLIMIEE